MQRRIAWGVLVALIGALFAWFLVLPRLSPHIFAGAVIQSTQKAPRMELQSSDGSTVRMTDFEGKVVVVYFGYTFCPDVCPATLSKLADALELLGDKAKDVQVMMVSVDPERDTPELLADYVAHFHPDFLGITSDEATVNRVATLYGVFYQKSEGTEATGYTIDHTSTVILVDREGYLKLVLPFEGTAEQIAADIDYFLG
ncbi:MAG: SCO family protein [Acidimicrobiia bacterium]|nr:SCO family protein [Acidimicrobiia bacterium]MDX2468468.1 SCO family protein [Acidimicrobiia bacterium]